MNPTDPQTAESISEEVVCWFVQIVDPQRPKHIAEVRRLIAPLIAARESAERKLADANCRIASQTDGLASLLTVRRALQRERDELRKKLADMECLHRNCINSIEHTLAPEWPDANREMIDSGNQSWTGVVEIAIGRIRAKLSETERDHAEWMNEHEQMFDRMNKVIVERDQYKQECLDARAEASRAWGVVNSTETKTAILEGNQQQLIVERDHLAKCLEATQDSLRAAIDAEREMRAIVEKFLDMSSRVWTEERTNWIADLRAAALAAQSANREAP